MNDPLNLFLYHNAIILSSTLTKFASPHTVELQQLSEPPETVKQHKKKYVIFNYPNRTVPMLLEYSFSLFS